MTVAPLAHRARALSSFPAHTVLTMPALSPTMEAGGIAGWTVEEGGSISAGASICEIETDKATMDVSATLVCPRGFVTCELT